MKAFESVNRNSKQRFVNEQQKAFAADKARLIAAMKREYGISDFNKLSESEKNEFKSVIDEMWCKDTGLKEKGIKFLSESCAPLTERSSDEQISKWFKKEVKLDIDNIIACLTSKDECGKVTDAKKCIEESIGRRLKNSDVKKWLYDVVCKHIGQQIKSLKF